MTIPLLVILGLIIVTDLCDTVSQLVLKSSINQLKFQVDSIKKIIHFLLRLALVPRVWIGLVFSLFSLLLWLFVLSKADLSLAYSMDSLRYVFITFASVVVLKEHVGKMRWMGIAAIVIGIMMVSHG
jgi:drug/metabolite transporter (DMT)-like permease